MRGMLRIVHLFCMVWSCDLLAYFGYLVSAITVFGDPTFTHSQSFDRGTDTTTDGVSPSFFAFPNFEGEDADDKQDLFERRR